MKRPFLLALALGATASLSALVPPQTTKFDPYSVNSPRNCPLIVSSVQIDRDRPAEMIVTVKNTGIQILEFELIAKIPRTNGTIATEQSGRQLLRRGEEAPIKLTKLDRNIRPRDTEFTFNNCRAR